MYIKRKIEVEILSKDGQKNLPHIKNVYNNIKLIVMHNFGLV